MRCIRLMFIPVLAGFLAGCVHFETPPAIGKRTLLSGESIFGKEVAAVEPVEIMALTDEMREWVHAKTGEYPHARVRLHRLLGGLIEDGLLSLKYDPNLTLTAAETFEAHQGNCLSFSILFSALARETGLTTHFRMVRIPPSFTSENDFVLLNNHINVEVKRVTSDGDFVQDHIVDFNSAEFDGNYESRQVSDHYVESLFHSNVAVEAMRKGDTLAAFRHLKKGLLMTPDLDALWVNLGAVYSRQGLYQHAESAYLHALRADPWSRSALVNLANLHDWLGNTETAAAYRRRVQNHLESNPYYHQQLALEALDEGRFELAARHINAAIDRNPGEHKFFHTKARVHYATGETGQARRDIEVARNLARTESVRRRYASKLAGLGDR